MVQTCHFMNYGANNMLVYGANMSVYELWSK